MELYRKIIGIQSKTLPNLGESWLFFLVMIVCSIFAGAILVLLGIKDTFITYVMSMTFPICFLLFLGNKSNHKVSVPVNKASYGNVNPVVLLFCLALLVPSSQIIIEPATSWMTMPDFIKELLKSMSELSFSNIMSVVVAAPLLEELLLRGYIEKGLIYHSNAKKAIIWSAIIFAVMHLNPWQGIPAFALGVIFGWIYWRTHNLWLTIFMHFVNNGTSLLLVFLYPESALSEESTKEIIERLYSAEIYYMLYGISVLIFILIINYLNKNLSKGEELFPQKQFMTL